MIKVGIIGATGYAGAELVGLLSNHPKISSLVCGSKSYAEQDYVAVYPHFNKIVDEKCIDPDIDELSKEVDVIFTATPQGYCATVLTKDILSRTKVIDLSADFRIKDVSIYEKWYGITHKSPQFIEEAVYGLCEIHREDIQNSRLIANPGCYTTCSILTLYPLLKAGLIKPESLIIDAKSGTSGAGRGAKVATAFCEVNENVKAYGVASHRHTPEIEEQLKGVANEDIVIDFTPHLIPMNRGILVTAYGDLKEGVVAEDIQKAYEAQYGNEPFIRLLGNKPPETRFVKGSNYVDISFLVNQRTNRVILMGAIDNLVKGAAGQAVQNMNILFGFEETMGLKDVPMFP